MKMNKLLRQRRINMLRRRRINILRHRIRNTFTKLVIHIFETNNTLANILDNMLDDVQVDNSKCKYEWHIMGKCNE